MKIGISSYSFATEFAAGTMDILDAVDWVAETDASHLEIAIAGLGSQLINDPDLVARLKRRAAEKGVLLANYVAPADFQSGDSAAEIAILKQHIDVAHLLGIIHFRHDVVAWNWRESDQGELEAALLIIVPACQEIADYAATLGITTSVENHGFFMNNSERVRRLIYAVDRPNFRMTLDVGNFLCVDEMPLSAVGQSLPYASVVHLKDFYIRDSIPGEGWLRTLAGRSILGSIVGFGDLPVAEVIQLIKRSGFDGPISIEFEGLEDSRYACATGLANARRLWDAA
jgi:sugar phosphate isomerase/epimerase